MSTILATEIIQARHDAALAASKLLLENSCYELRNTPINAKSLFRSKIKEVAKGNYEAQQQRFLASSSTDTNLQQQKMAYLAPFKRPRQPNKPSRPKQMQPYRPKSQSQSYSATARKDYSKRSGNSKQFPFSKHALFSRKFWNPTLSTARLAMTRYSSGRKVGPLCGTMGRVNRQQMGPHYRSKRFQDTIQISSSTFRSSDKSELIFLPIITRRDRRTSPKTGSGKGTRSGTPNIYNRLFLIPKKNGKFCPVIDLSILNQYIRKQPFKMETVKSVRQLILVNDWAVSVDLTDAYLHVPINPQTRKYLRFIYGHQIFQFTVLLSKCSEVREFSPN